MSWLRRLFTENLGLKVLALGMAIVLWAVVGSDPITEAIFTVPLEFVNVPASLEVLTDHPTVQLWARGPSNAVRSAAPGDFVVRVNLASVAGQGEHTFSLNPSSVVSPAPLRVVEIIPSEISLTLERTVTKEVPIDPRFSGDPAPGYRLKDFAVTPNTAKVVGPVSRVERIVSAGTDPVDISHLQGDRTFVTNLYAPDPLVRFAGSRAIEVTVRTQKMAPPASAKSHTRTPHRRK